MLTEIKRNKKSKAVIVAVIVFSLITLVSCGVQPKKENNSLISKKTEIDEVKKENNSLIFKKPESDEVSITYGKWVVKEYMGESVEFHGAELTTKAQKSEHEKTIKEIKEKYLNKELHIDSKSIAYFSPPNELGYEALTWSDLFFLYRQPADIWDGISPPFVCITLRIKDYDDYFDIIVDANGIATLEVKGLFFRLEKIVTG